MAENINTVTETPAKKGFLKTFFTASEPVDGIRIFLKKEKAETETPESAPAPKKAKAKAPPKPAQEATPAATAPENQQQNELADEAFEIVAGAFTEVHKALQKAESMDIPPDSINVSIEIFNAAEKQAQDDELHTTIATELMRQQDEEQASEKLHASLPWNAKEAPTTSTGSSFTLPTLASNTGPENNEEKKEHNKTFMASLPWNDKSAPSSNPDLAFSLPTTPAPPAVAKEEAPKPVITPEMEESLRRRPHKFYS